MEAVSKYYREDIGELRSLLIEAACNLVQRSVMEAGKRQPR